MIPASKRRRQHYATSDTAIARSLQEMFLRPMGERAKDGESDSDDSDLEMPANRGDKEGTKQYHLTRAVDKMLLQGGFGGLQTWIEEDPPCRILSPTEYRYEAKHCTEFEDHEAPIWQRWCVEDTATNKRRFEVPASRGDHSRPLIVAFTDEDGSQVSLLQGLVCGAFLRMWFFNDPFHRIWNDIKLALMEAGLWSDVYERLHCENLPCGPFGSAAWWREMQEVMAHHFRVSNRFNELFLILYLGLEAEACDAGAVQSPTGTPEAAVEVWAWLKSVAKMTRAHRLTKTKTWFEPLVAMRLGIKVHTAYLYVLCILCQDQGHMQTVADMPVHGGALPPAIVEELPGDAILSRKMEGGKDCLRLRALRARCANNCVAACHLQGYADSKPRTDIILTVCGPVWKSYGMDYKYLKEPKQVKLKYVNAARSGYDPEVRRVFAVMRDAAFIGRALASSDTVSIVADTAYAPLKTALQELHTMHGAPSPSGGALPPAGPKMVHFEYHPFQILAAERVHLTWRLMAATARHRALSGGRFRHSCPGQFAALISKHPEIRDFALQVQKGNLAVIVAVENLLYDTDLGPFLREVVGAVGFLHNPSVREVIFKLHQHDWRIVPPETQEQCKAAFKGLGHSRANEAGFKVTKDWKRTNHKGKSIKRIMRHFIPVLKKGH